MAALWVAGCHETGQVSIELVLPDDPALSPAGDRLAQITLLTWGPDQPLQRETQEIEDPSLGADMGALKAGTEVEVAVELRSATGRLIGYGRSPQPIAPEGEGDTIVPIQVRRPYVYAGGAEDRLEVFDSSLDAGEDGTYGTLPVPAPVATAGTPDGAELVVVSALAGGGALLRVVATRTHTEIAAAPIPLAGDVSDVAVTADGAFALVGHQGEAGGLSVVDLDAARDGREEVTFTELGAVGAVVAVHPGDDQPARALALVDRSHAFGCDDLLPASSVATITLGAAPEVGDAVELAGPAADIAATPDGRTLYVAEPCAGAVTALDFDAGGAAVGTPRELVPLEQATSVAVQGGRVWGAGTLPPDRGDGARVVLVQSGLDGADASRFELPPAQERAQSTDFEGEDQSVEVVIDADDLRTFELASLPGGELVALLTEGSFHSEEWTDIFGDPVVSEIELTTFEYLLVDVSSRAVVHQLRTFCEGTAVAGAALENFRCGKAPGQDSLDDATKYRPSQLSALFGGR